MSPDQLQRLDELYHQNVSQDGFITKKEFKNIYDSKNVRAPPIIAFSYIYSAIDLTKLLIYHYLGLLCQSSI